MGWEDNSYYPTWLLMKKGNMVLFYCTFCTWRLDFFPLPHLQYYLRPTVAVTVVVDVASADIQLTKRASFVFPVSFGDYSKAFARSGLFGPFLTLFELSVKVYLVFD